MAKFVCSVCGYVHEDLTVPEQCPICTAPAFGFSVVEDTPSQRRGTHTTNTKLDERNHTGFGSMNHPDSFIGIVIEPKCLGDTDKLNNGLAILAEEDPTFTVRTDEQSGQNIISGVGELHLDIIIDRLKREFEVECNMGKPQVNYKEAFTKTVEIDETYKKQSGGRVKYAKMLVQVGPVDEDYDLKNNPSLQFVNEVKGGNIPKEFIPSIQKGFEAAMKNGVLGGYPLDSLKVTVVDGGFHPLDSDQLSFEIAAQMAFEEACSKADPVLLEPIMKIKVETSEESMDAIINDLNKRRGEVEAMYEVRSGIRLIKAQVPLSEIHGYDISLQAITSGHTSWSVEYDHYAPLPDSIAKMVLGIKPNPTSIQDEYYYSEEDIKEIMGFAPSKLRAAKWYQEKYNCSLKDAKDVVDKVWEKQRQELTLNGMEQVEGKGCIITILIAITSTLSMFCLI